MTNTDTISAIGTTFSTILTSDGLPEQVALARDVATSAHAGQTRKLGIDKDRPYIVHSTRVAGALMGVNEVAWAAGYLHDVIEDTPVTAMDLIAVGIRPAIVNVVTIVSRLPSKWDGGYAESYLDFILRIKASHNAEAIAVKLADLTDNSYDLPAGARVDKYEMAKYILTH